MAENETFENLTHEINADFGVVYEVQRDKVLYGTTEYWEAQTELVGKEGYLYIYSDYKQNSQEQDVIGIKVGDGETLLSELTFSDAYTEEQIASILTSVSTLISTKMNVSNPTGTGAFSMNRKANTTVGQYSSTLGRDNEASGMYSHAEGANSTASGESSHAEGYITTASGSNSHAEGNGTKASSMNQHVSGKFNVEDVNGTYAEIIGNGTNENNRSNARTLDWSGNEMIAGDLIFNGNTSLATALGAKADASSVPTKVSDLQNDTGFITSTVNNLSNYYKKTETYTQAEVNSLISAITTLNIVVVQTLPTQDISTTTIYLVPKSTAQTENVYDEYIYVNNSWELIGTTAVDLSNYYTKSEVDTALSGKANSSDVYSKSDVDTALALKADSSDVYTKDETDALLAEKASYEWVIKQDGIEAETPYLMQATPNTAGDRELDLLVGGTVAFNQLVQNGDFASTSEWTPYACQWSTNNNIATIKVKSGISGFGSIYQSVPIKLNHKVLILADIKPDGVADSFLRIDGNVSLISYKSVSGSNFQTASFLVNGTADGAFRVLLSSYADVEFYAKNVMTFDLTQMFGSTIADYIYSLEQGTAGAGVAWFRNLFPKSYYAYNSGSLMSVKTSKHITVGFNQWDEEWELGNLNDQTGATVSATDRIRSKNFIPVVPNTSYFALLPNLHKVIFYDADKNFISGGDTAWVYTQSYTTGANCHFIKFVMAAAYGTTYKNDICINLSWDRERNGEYEPYVKHEYDYSGEREVTRYFGYRDYESGDESLADAVTDGTHTVYKLATPTTETVSNPELRGIPKLDANNKLYYYGDTCSDLPNPQICEGGGSEEYVDTRDVPIPVGHDSIYSQKPNSYRYWK